MARTQRVARARGTEARRSDGEYTRAKLLNAGEALASEMPFAHVTVDHVTTLAGTGRATFYLYFKNINEFFIELGRVACDELYAAARASWGKADPREAIEGFIRTYVQTFRRHAGVMGVCYSRRFLDEGYTDLLVGTRKRIIDGTARDIEQGIAAGLYADVDATLVSDALVCMLEALCVHELDDGRKGSLKHVVNTLSAIWMGVLRD